MPYRFVRSAFLSVALLLVTASLHAQGWPLPAKTQNTDVPCNTTPCPKDSSGAKTYWTPGYGAPIKTFVGRYLDSQSTSDWQGTFRTARAREMRISPTNNRIYTKIGNAIFAYDMAKFYSRLAAGAPMMKSTGIGVSPANYRTTDAETFLSPDEWFYAEFGGDWVTTMYDGQERLFGWDWDDRGYLYMAYSGFGWGLGKDEGSASGAAGRMAGPLQKTASEDISATGIVAVKTGGKYYAVVSNLDMANNAVVWDVTTPTTAGAVKVRNLRVGFKEYFAKAADGAIAVMPIAGGLSIYSPEGLVGGGPATATFSAPSGSSFVSLTSAGNDIWAASSSQRSPVVLHRFRPSGFGQYVEDRFTTNYTYIYPPHITYGDGYIVMGGFDSSWTLRMFKVLDNGVQEFSFNNYFSKYYTNKPYDARYAAPSSAYLNVTDGLLHKFNGKYYLIVGAKGLGDVYELQTSDSVDVTIKRTSDQVNPYSQQPSGSGPFYGDRITFTAASSGAAMNLNWNFGNPEAASNVASSQTGSDVSHQFSNITSLPTTREVKATNAADSSVSGSVNVLQQNPTPRVAIKSTSFVFLQPDASSTVPIVTSDDFVDASDGSVEGHFATWNRDSVQTRLLPNVAFNVGGCGAHTLAFTGSYGPYSVSGSTISSVGTPYNVGINPINYTAKPFAANVTYTSSGDQVVFSSATRVSSFANDLLAGAGTSVTYQWDLVSGGAAAAPTVFLAGPTGTATLGTVPQWSVAKSSFSQTGLYARLRLTVAPAALGTSCAGFEESSATVGPLNGPDPTDIQVTGCANALSSCTFAVGSLSGQSKSNWTYAWSIAGVGNSSQATWSPTIQNQGNYTVSLTVTNPIGTKTVSKAITVGAALCNSNPATGKFTINGTCSTTPCKPGSTVAFTISSWGYTAGDCDDYTWNFGISTTGKEKERKPSVTYSSAGTYNVTLTIKNTQSGVTGTASLPLTISSGSTNPNPNPNPVTCSTMSSSNIFVSFQNASGSCSQNGGQCGAGDNITFTAASFGYSFNCAVHTFTWDFDDGSQKSGQSANKAFTTAGSHPVTLTINNGSQTYTTTVNVTVSGTSNPPGGGSCPTMNASNMAVSASSGGTLCNANTPCSPNTAISFNVQPWGYQLSCAAHTFTWTFPDNSTQTGQTVTKSFAADGTYNVQLEIKNSGQTYNVTVPVTIKGNPATPAPTIDFDYTVFSAPYTYKFTPTTSIAGSVTKWVWSFSDGESITSTTMNPSYKTFPGPGTYTVTLTGSDATRGFAPVSKTITIEDKPIPARGGRPVRGGK